MFSNCIPVKGAKRSIICDLQRNQFDFIPNDLYEVLQQVGTKTYREISEPLNADDKETLDEYFAFLIEKDYGFWCSKEEIELLPQLDLTFQSPSIITNAIIDVSLQSQHNFGDIYRQLADLGCKHLQIRFFCGTSLSNLYTVLQPLITNRINSVQLVIQASDELGEEELIELCRKNMKVINITVSGAPKKMQSLVGVDQYTSLTFLTEVISDSSHCGNIHYLFFATNIQAFSESLQFNSCLNRKIAIDTDGSIKNCPSMKQNYGSIKSNSLKSALQHPDFKKVWGIHKDQIEECMDCEFRHICTDCRAFIQDNDNINSKPLKCKYNPYTATWNN